MSTKPPSTITESPAGSLEKIAYGSVSSIPTQEPNDRNRLGYHVWRWLVSKQGSLEQAVAESASRIHVTQQEAVKIIREVLAQQGISAN